MDASDFMVFWLFCAMVLGFLLTFDDVISPRKKRKKSKRKAKA